MKRRSGERRVVAGADDDAVSPSDKPADRILVASRYVRIVKFSELTGYSVKAVSRKIEDGIWIEGKEYRRAPDGNICVDLEGFEKWVEGGRVRASSR